MWIFRTFSINKPTDMLNKLWICVYFKGKFKSITPNSGFIQALFATTDGQKQIQRQRRCSKTGASNDKKRENPSPYFKTGKRSLFRKNNVTYVNNRDESIKMQ